MAFRKASHLHYLHLLMVCLYESAAAPVLMYITNRAVKKTNQK